MALVFPKEKPRDPRVRSTPIGVGTIPARDDSGLGIHLAGKLSTERDLVQSTFRPFLSGADGVGAYDSRSTE